MARVTVVSDVRRRCDWSDEERMEILGEAVAPGAIVPVSLGGKAYRGA